MDAQHDAFDPGEAVDAGDSETGQGHAPRGSKAAGTWGSPRSQPETTTIGSSWRGHDPSARANAGGPRSPPPRRACRTQGGCDLGGPSRATERSRRPKRRAERRARSLAGRRPGREGRRRAPRRADTGGSSPSTSIGEPAKATVRRGDFGPVGRGTSGRGRGRSGHLGSNWRENRPPGGGHTAANSTPGTDERPPPTRPSL